MNGRGKGVRPDLLNRLFPSEAKKAVDPTRDAEYQRRHPKHVDTGGEDVACHVARTHQERRVDNPKNDRQCRDIQQVLGGMLLMEPDGWYAYCRERQ